MEKTNKPTVAGILAIITGVLGLLWAICLFIVIRYVVGTLFDIMGGDLEDIQSVLLVIVILLAIVAILALVGGIYALQRKIWGLALAGAIATILIFFPLGIPTIVLVAQSKNEF